MSEKDSPKTGGDENKVRDRTEPFVMALDETPEVGDAVKEDPLVQSDLSEGAVPLTERFKDRRTQLSIIVPVLVLILFAVALPGFELDILVGHVLSADPVWLVVAFAIYYLGFPLRGYRWSLLLRGIGANVGVRDSTEILFVSWLVNSVVPAKLGEVYRAWLLKVNFPVSLSATFGTIFIERIFDIFAIVILGLGAAFWSFRSGLDDTVRLIMLVGIIVVVVMAVALFTLRNFGRRLVERLPLPDRAKDLYEHFEDGVFSVDRRTLPLVAFLTLLIWTTEALRLLFVVEALGFEISLGISGAFFVALVASLLTAVPFTPAGLGIVEAGIVGLLTVVYQADPNEAAAIALVDRAISVLSVIVLGFIAYLLSPKTKGGRSAMGPDDPDGGSAEDERPAEQEATTA
ncbi:MAG: lysylphosphatidylglycerol synthase transmembrane domain-containing protein [Chloroflexota bacterium]|nr:lysylphosphatidylglycerol synthase transmembrane domain-containing protein [Chloroflexota bacterium]